MVHRQVLETRTRPEVNARARHLANVNKLSSEHERYETSKTPEGRSATFRVQVFLF